MTQDEARHMERLLKLCGMPGVAAPVDDPVGEWRIYDRPESTHRVDITADAVRGLRSTSRATDEKGTAARGFIVPDST